jgi:hypothetical protein
MRSKRSFGVWTVFIVMVLLMSSAIPQGWADESGFPEDNFDMTDGIAEALSEFSEQDPHLDETNHSPEAPAPEELHDSKAPPSQSEQSVYENLPEPEGRVWVWTQAGRILYEGDPVILEAVPEGFLIHSLAFSWQRNSTFDDNGVPVPEAWRDVDKEKLSYLVLEASDAVFASVWRAVVTVNGKTYIANASIKPHYKVVFKSEDGYLLDTPLYAERDANLTRYAPVAPFKEGYAFAGWTSSRGTSLRSIRGASVFTAAYEKLEPPGEDPPAHEEPGPEPGEQPEAPEEPGEEPDEEPAWDEDPEDPEEDDEEPELPYESPWAPERSVSVERLLPEIIMYGDSFIMNAILEGFEDAACEILWEMRLETGEWVAAGSGETLTVVADSFTVNCAWRACVICHTGE